MTTRIAVIGAGVIGKLRAQTVEKHPDCTLVAVADPDAAAAGRVVQGTGAATVSSPDNLWDYDLDAVIVCTPLPLHEQHVLPALGRDLHVLCEKPLGNTVESCRRMVAEAKTRGVTLAVGFNHRYYPSIKFLKTAVDEGRIGTIDHLRVCGAHDGLANFRADWQYQSPDSGGGAMMDVGIHMTDLARYIGGEITEVYGCATEKVWQVPGSEDNAVAVFRTQEGVPMTYQATWTEWRGYQFYVDVYGDRGMVRGYYAPMFNLLVTQPEPGGPRKTTRRFYPEVMLREKFQSWETTALRSFEDELTDFLRMVRGETANNADGVAGLRAVEIAQAVYQSTRTGEAVHLPAPGTTL